MSKKRSLKKSFFYAFSGLKEASLREPNFQLHLVFATFFIILGAILGLSNPEWLVLIFTISFVMILELINTSLEAIVDLVSPDVHPKAKIAKDVAAASVLIAALTSVVIGISIFLPKLLDKLQVILNR